MAANRAESLVNWYLRFNGYFTVPNFTVHPNTKKGCEAEADFIAVRFPLSHEQAGRYKFQRDQDLIVLEAIDFLLVEVKAGLCALNSTWTDPSRRNIEYALRWIGDLPPDCVNDVAAQLYSKGATTYGLSTDTMKRTVRLVSFGSYLGEESKSQKEAMPNVLQMSLSDAVCFVRKRLKLGCPRLHRENWDSYIQDFVRLTKQGVNDELLLEWTLGRVDDL